METPQRTGRWWLARGNKVAETSPDVQGLRALSPPRFGRGDLEVYVLDLSAGTDELTHGS